MRIIWDFIQNQILGMKWLNELTGSLISLMGLDLNSKIGSGIQFFIYDTLKISILLMFLIFIISYIQTYFPPERTKQILSKYNGIWGNILSALLGTVTPFCSCSSIPIFIGFTNAGLPLGMTFSFLISSPLVDLGSLVLLTSIFGFKIAVAYVIVGLVIAVAGGTVIGKLKLENHLEPKLFGKAEKLDNTSYDSRKKRCKFALSEAWETWKYVIKFILIGVAVGAVIHNWIPDNIIETILGNKNPFSVIIASLVGIPMYADIFGTIPIAEALYFKGVGIGTVLSFMMSVTALSLPSMIMLRKVVKPKLLGIFIGIVTLGIIIMGYLFNIFGGIFI
ncbi:MAG: permease [Ruminococcus sp.]|nr:permease [Oscillospiraceae bacterium]MDY4414317.1 permease [Ruminococcus sp.]